MDIISIVNTMQPGTISKLAKNSSDFPNGEPSIPYMGMFVQLFPNAVLPDPAAVAAYVSTYNAAIAAQQAATKVPDIVTQLATALIAKGVLSKSDIAANTLNTINANLTNLGKLPIT